MKKLLIAVVAFGICEISEGMKSDLDVVSREIEISFNSRTLVLNIQIPNKAHEEIHMTAVSDEQFKASMPSGVVSSVIARDLLNEVNIQSLLDSLSTSRFGINPSIDFVLMDDSNERFNKLFAELSDSIYRMLPCCSRADIETIIKHLKMCSGNCTQTAYSAIAEFSESKGDEISRVESYFYNVSEKLDILVDMISLRIGRGDIKCF